MDEFCEMREKIADYWGHIDVCVFWHLFIKYSPNVTLVTFWDVFLPSDVCDKYQVWLSPLPIQICCLLLVELEELKDLEELEEVLNHLWNRLWANPQN